ncbi:MAG: polyphosphate:AMP phosphotransferase [Gammaproteobacteria bacterium]|nr:MAG: polyphosphate:AMP phosphotransferase [Gammaproteobacteria bacterium]
MFEAAELGRKIAKKDFDEEEPLLHTNLLEVQRKLKDSGTPVIIIVSGVEGAGKGEVVNRLNEWFDTRGLQTYAFWDESDEERERPFFWRFWRSSPPRGTIGIMFGSWYTKPIINLAFGDIDGSEFDRQLTRIAEYERMLTNDGALVVKFWFHMSKKDLRKRLKKEAQENGKNWKVSPLAKKFSKHYNKFCSVSERAIRITDQGKCPWYLVEAVDRRYRDITVGRILLNAIEQRLNKQSTTEIPASPQKSITTTTQKGMVTILDHVDLKPKLSDTEYRRLLGKYQRKFYKLAWAAREKKRSSIAVFEGWDASGKGGAIRRLTAAMDARLHQVISIASPTDEEKAQHYLWRFWRHVPRGGYVTIYDRSWYGRVLVERVEQFAKENEWMRSYQEINNFEEQLCEHGIIVVKFWVHISKAEQLRRFKEREKIPWKVHKITEEDWRNREKWDDYKAAINDMVSRTSTEYAPWTLVPGNDKKYARIEILKTFCNTLEKAIS